jgi:plasmid stabilization system protein ParE
VAPRPIRPPRLFGENAQRYGAARETDYFNEEVRQLLYKSHRFLFRIEETEMIVRILYVRHGKQRALGEPQEGDVPDDDSH